MFEKRLLFFNSAVVKRLIYNCVIGTHTIDNQAVAKRAHYWINGG
jgi:hypothetical protein